MKSGLRFSLALCVFFSFGQGVQAGTHYPVTVANCQETLTFNAAPERAVFNDLNMTEMAFELGLQPRMIAVSGISGWYKTTDEFKKELGSIPEISPRNLTLEPLLKKEPDFLFAGWNYGLKIGSELTPDNLAGFGIKTLVLSESCAHIDKNRPKASMDLLYADVLKLGKIFDRQQQAEALINRWQQELAVIARKVSGYPRQKVFLYDSGIEKPFTSGRFAMPQALIDYAGGVNVATDNQFSWSVTSWEAVAIKNPDLIILVDYGTDGAMGPEQLKEVLAQHPLMSRTNAFKNQRFLLLKYSEITPGPKNIQAIRKIAASLYPQAGILIDA